MKNRNSTICTIIGLAVLAMPAALADKGATKWRLAGDLSEACSCSVPCTCNFGEQPSPHHFCYALYSLDIQNGNYGDVDLSGLKFAGAMGQKGIVWYIDEKASKEQAAALRQIGQVMYDRAIKLNGIKSPTNIPPEMKLRGFKTSKIEQIVAEKKNYLKIGNQGSFAATYIMGLDGKTPVVVENNWSWNIQHGIKGKTKNLSYHDSFGNQFDFAGTNANQGKFDWNESTPVYFR